MKDSTSVMPLVSVVIPAYNHANYLEEAILSVLAQDYPHLEIIVIDDGSTDDTLKVLENLQGDFRWFTQRNIGQSSTLTRGWEMSKGEILAYLSADDALEPHAVKCSVSALNAMPDAAAVYCDFNLIDPESRMVKTVKLPEFDYEDMLKRVWCPIGPGAFFRRAAYLKAGSWNPDLREMPDYDFWLRLGLYGKFLHIPQVLAGFRVHAGSTSYSITPLERAEEPVKIVSSLLARKEAIRFEHSLQARAMASANLVSAQLHLRAGRFYRAVHHIRKAWHFSAVTVLAPRTLHLIVNAVFTRTGHRLLWIFRNIVGKAANE